MLSFHSDPAIKARYLWRVAAHRAADEIAQGVYYQRRGEHLRACAVGCTIHGDDPAAYERELGIPSWLAHLEDAIHEGLSLAACRAWPGAFLRAIPVGVDLAPLQARYFAWLGEVATARYAGRRIAVAAADAAWSAALDVGSAAGAAARAAGADDARAAFWAARAAFWVLLRDWLLAALRAQRRA